MIQGEWIETSSARAIADFKNDLSLMIQGEWIETYKGTGYRGVLLISLWWYRESGLKLSIYPSHLIVLSNLSLMIQGEWIETSIVHLSRMVENWSLSDDTGRVDWNVLYCHVINQCSDIHLSLMIQGEWIETLFFSLVNPFLDGSSLSDDTGRVDWNNKSYYDIIQVLKSLSDDTGRVDWNF